MLRSLKAGMLCEEYFCAIIIPVGRVVEHLNTVIRDLVEANGARGCRIPNSLEVTR